MFSASGLVYQLIASCSRCASTSAAPVVSKSVKFIKQILPQLSHDLYKGQCGRIGIIGGSKEYTGAPYYAAISALKTGGDLAHVICPAEAATVIKSYSPELIVHPILDVKQTGEVKQWLERFHAVVLGPGLGRKEEIMPLLKEIAAEARRRSVPLIVDADGLFYVTKDPNLVKDNKLAILTPNVVEFVRLYYAVNGTNPDRNSADPSQSVKSLSESLGNVTIVQKGKQDIISDGISVLACNEEGSPRRCGGQGDLLSGALGTFAAFAQQASENKELKYGPSLTAAYSACYLTKECNRRAYDAIGRSTTTVDMIETIKDVMKELDS